MQKPLYSDLLLVLILTLITVIVLLIPENLFTLTAPAIYIPYILLLLFLPGYSLLAAGDPEFATNGRATRVGLSLVVSLVISILLAALITYTPLNILSGVIVYVLGGFTIILTLTAILRRSHQPYVHFLGLEGQDLELDQVEMENSHRFDEHGIINDLFLNTGDINRPQPELGDNQELVSDELPDLKRYEQDKIKLDQPFEPEKGEANESGTSPMETEHKAVQVEEKSSELAPEESKAQNGDKQPRRSSYLDLVVVLLLNVVCTFFILEPSLNQSMITSVIGVLLMVFLPGYAIITTIYPRLKDLSTVTRLVLSFGVSYFLTSVIGLVLNYTHLGNSLNPILLALSGITFVFIVIAFFMRMRAGKNLSGDISTTTGTSALGGHRNVLMVGVVAVIILLIAAPTVFNLIKPADVVAANSTDFYVLGPDGHNFTSAYPQNLTSGQTGTVTIVLVNHESVETNYQIVTRSDQNVMDEINVTLKPNEKREIPYNFTVGENGTRNMEFLLFKLPNLNDVYHSFNFLLKIVSQNTTSESGASTDQSSDTGTQDTSDYSDTPDYTPPQDNGDYNPPDYTPPDDTSQDNQDSGLDDYQSQY